MFSHDAPRADKPFVHEWTTVTDAQEAAPFVESFPTEWTPAEEQAASAAILPSRTPPDLTELQLHTLSLWGDGQAHRVPVAIRAGLRSLQEAAAPPGAGPPQGGQPPGGGDGDGGNGLPHWFQGFWSTHIRWTLCLSIGLVIGVPLVVALASN